MAAYYYMMSSLPALSIDAKAPFSWEAFLALCVGNISGSDYANLSSLSLEKADGCDLARRWTAFRSMFAHKLTSERRKRHGLPAEVLSDEDTAINACVSEALAETDPLKAELMMLSFMFRKVDEMAYLAQFERDALFSYAIKLRLLLRKDEFSAMEGKAEYKRLFSNMQSVIFDTTSTQLE